MSAIMKKSGMAQQPGSRHEVSELISVDMAAVGDGQSSDEFHATLCVKDSGGPYHHGLSQRLRQLAETYHIPHKIDIYPYYGSDGEAFGGQAAMWPWP
jgi:putative aminopeptidase FrvX